MKKSLLALAALGAFAGGASAQSSVTLYGVLDAGITRESTSGQHWTGLASSQLANDRLGFKGTEDLGGGLSANFDLEGNFHVGNGTGTGGSGGGFSFDRGAWLGLASKTLGEVRLGRDYSPMFWNWVFFDAFEANGIPEALNFASTAGVSTPGYFNMAGNSAALGPVPSVWSNNAVTYILPGNIGGVYGSVQAAMQNGTVTPGTSNKNYSGRIGWAGYGADVAVGYGDVKTAPVLTSAGASDTKTANVGASYDFGLAKILGFYNQTTYTPPGLTQGKAQTEELSANVPIGLGGVKASWVHGSYSGSAATLGKADQYGGEYYYNLSKRTTLYVSAATIRNKNGGQFDFNLDGLPLVVAPNASVNAYNAGIKHSF